MNPLKAVPTTLPEPPYPDDVTLNGWKVGLDWDRIKASDTWTLAEEDERPWLLRIWAEALGSVPAGSMPADMNLFARRIGCKRAFLVAHEVLIRGWILHSDDRLYHAYIVNEVKTMLVGRQKNARRVKKWRDKKVHGEINTEENQQTEGGCNALPTRTYTAVMHGTGLGLGLGLGQDLDRKGQNKSKQTSKTPTEKSKEETPRAKKTSPARPVPKSKPMLNFNSWPQAPDPDQWAEILTHRKKKRASNTQRAFNLLGKQLHSGIAAGYTFDECMETWESRQWAGFNPAWMDPKSGAKGNGNGYKTVPQQHDEVLANFITKQRAGDTPGDTPGDTLEGDFYREH